jgi:hypothetical protein
VERELPLYAVHERSPWRVFQGLFMLWSPVNSVLRREFVPLLPVNLAGKEKWRGRAGFENSSRSLLANVRGIFYYITFAALVQV